MNYFLHRWGIYGMSKFVNAVLFSPRSDTGEDITVIPTVTDVTVAFATINGATPEYATKGTTTRWGGFMNLPNSVVQLCVIRTIVRRLSNITEGSSELLQMIPILDVFSTKFRNQLQRVVVYYATSSC